jgi:tungstate transport system permease protein
MRYILEMITQGLRLLHHDPNLHSLTVRTIQLAVESTVIAGILGFPAAVVIGLGRSRVSRGALIAANAGLGLPPVALGVYLGLLLPGYKAPWGGGIDGSWMDSLNGMVLAQTILALPVIIALGAVAIRRLPAGLIDQAGAFGASRVQLAMFTLREAKIGVIAAVIVALGSAISEVGAVTLIGGNDTVHTATLASQILHDVAGYPGTAGAVEHAIVLLAMMLVLGVIFTVAQQAQARSLHLRPRRPRRAQTLVAEVST